MSAYPLQNALLNNLWPQNKSGEINITFDGGTADAIGDQSGTNNPYTLATVTGTVELVIIATCTTNLVSAGGGSLEVGVAGATAVLIAQSTATDIDAGEIWHDASPDAAVEVSTVITRKIVTKDVIMTVGTADITAGVIKFDIFWNPISANGKVVVGADA